jgi:hypothetical protein
MSSPLSKKRRLTDGYNKYRKNGARDNLTGTLNEGVLIRFRIFRLSGPVPLA